VAASPPLRLLLAGAGLFGREHLDRLVRRADVQVVGVADPSPGALENIRTRYAIADLFPDAEAMIECVPADGLIVATPSATHVDLTLKALARGMAVLLEKPVAPSPDLALRLAVAAERHGRLVLPGHVLRFSKDHQRVAEIIASGGIGKPLYVNSRRYRDEAHATRYSDVDPVLMTMIHDIDLALWFGGAQFRSARAFRRPGDGFRSMTVATCVAENGVVCDLRTAWTFTGGDLPPDRVEVVGDRGSVELELGGALSHFSGGTRQNIPLDPADDALANEQAHFIECMRAPHQKPALTLHDAGAGLLLAEALLRSIASGRSVDLTG
jgi:predicted dehydrogenase